MQTLQYVWLSLIAILATISGTLGWKYRNLQQDHRQAVMKLEEQGTSIAALQQKLDALEHPPILAVAGEVFIVTKGGTNIQLGLVEIGFHDAKEFVSQLAEISSERDRLSAEITPELDAARKEKERTDSLKEKAFQKYLDDTSSSHHEKAYEYAKAKAKKANEHYTAIAARWRTLMSARWLWSRLPPPIISCKTDSAGRFTQDIPMGAYACTASASRAVGNDTERYAWVVPVVTTGKSVKLTLSNHNMTSCDTSESLFRTYAD